MTPSWHRWPLLCLAGCVGWLAWSKPSSPWLTVLVVVLPLLMYGMVLAVEFACMHKVNRYDDAPRARVSQVVRAWWAELGLGVLVFCWRLPFFSQTEPDWLPVSPTGQRGVVLVHGFMANRGLWLRWHALLRERGHAHVAVNLTPVWGSINAYAAIIEAAVQQVSRATGRPPVLVCHSMGGLAARAWLHAYPEAAQVHRIVTLGTPHGGTWLGRFSLALNGRQMSLGGEWIQELLRTEPAKSAQRFTCWYSNCDNVVFPASTAALAGADNRFIDGLAHVQLALHPVVVQACLQEIARD